MAALIAEEVLRGLGAESADSDHCSEGAMAAPL